MMRFGAGYLTDAYRVGIASGEYRIPPIPIIYYVYYPVILEKYICTCQKKAVLLHNQ